MNEIDTGERKKIIDDSKSTKGIIRSIAFSALLTIDAYQRDEIQNKINGFDESEAVVGRLQHENKLLREEKSAMHKSIGTGAKAIKEQNTVIDLLRATVLAQSAYIAIETNALPAWGGAPAE